MIVALSSRWALGLAVLAAVVLLALILFRNAQASQPPAGVEAGEPQSVSVQEAKTLIEAGKAAQIPKNTWREILNPDQYRILWEKGTERPFTGELLNEKRAGVFVTAGCKLPVFSSEHKYKSGTGWPSFWDLVDSGNIVLKEDRSWGMRRVEVLSKCGEHLGHVFEDGPAPTGKRYCINSLALEFVPFGEERTSSVNSSAVN